MPHKRGVERSPWPTEALHEADSFALFDFVPNCCASVKAAKVSGLGSGQSDSSSMANGPDYGDYLSSDRLIRLNITSLMSAEEPKA